MLMHAHAAYGWHDETHLAVAKAAGYHKWYNAAGPDMAKIKAGPVEGYNHFYNNPSNAEISPAVIEQQITKYNNPRDKEGHLYGAIIAALREYNSARERGKYSEYHLAFAAHYLTDLSQPLHNIPYDDFNREHHLQNDGIVNRDVLNRVEKIQEQMPDISLRKDHLQEDLSREIARLANVSAILGQTLRKEDRTMTGEEAFRQLGHSASLLKAVLVALEK